MTDLERIELAERQSRGRAAVMAIAAVVLMVNAVFEFGEAPYAALSWRSGTWILLIFLWLLILGTGGALTRSGATKKLMNDELSLQNRSRAINFGFYLAMLAALVVYAANWFTPIATPDTVRLVTATGVASALGRYAWLEVM